MPVWFGPGCASFGNRNGESPFVTADTLESSNFESFYEGTGESSEVDTDVLCAAFEGTVNAMLEHYWAERDYEVQMDGHAQRALREMHPEWRSELVDRYGVGSQPEATVRLYTSETEVLVRRVFRNMSLRPDGGLEPPSATLPPGLTREGLGRPLSMAATDEAGQATQMLFRPFECPRDIPGLDYQEFIQTNFSEWTGNLPLRFFEKKPFYKALNAALAQDAPNVLRNAMPLIRSMNWYINQTRHAGGLVFSGVGLGRSADLLRASEGEKVRLPRFLSVSADENLAIAHLKGKVGPALLRIHVPEGFQGARYIEAITEHPGEQESLFCAYSLFRVLAARENALFVPPVLVVELMALDKYDERTYERYPSIQGNEELT